MKAWRCGYTSAIVRWHLAGLSCGSAPCFFQTKARLQIADVSAAGFLSVAAQGFLRGG
jgi:hypothetical protein